MNASPQPEPATVYALAAATPCDHRTARAYLLGREPRTYALAARLEIAAQRLGIAAERDRLARVARRVLRTGLATEERLAGIDPVVVVPPADERGGSR